MSKVTNQSTTCKSVCWLVGMVFGGALTYVLIYQMQSDRVLSGVAGIVVMLVIGLVLRRLFCKPAADAGETAYDPAAELAQTTATASRLAKKAAEPAAALAATAMAAAAKPAAKPVAEPEVLATPRAPAAGVQAKPRADETATPPDAPVSDAADAAIIQAVKEAVNPVDHVEDDELAKELFDWDPEEEAEFAALTNTSAEPETPAEAKTETAADATAADAPTGDAPAADVPPVVATPEEAVPAVAQAADMAEIKPLEPKGLDAPEGAADDLMKIKGLKADQQVALNEAGIFHFRQIVSLNRRELAWLNANIPGAAASMEAENWRKQAIQLSRQSG